MAETPSSIPKGVAVAIFVALVLVSLVPSVPGQVTLTVGMVVGLLGLNAFPKESKKVSRFLMQSCIVALGLRLNLAELFAAAADAFSLTIGSIVATLIAGLVLGRMLRAGRENTVLISSGTAICGATAIAAVGTSIAASAGAMAVSTGAIFILNAIGLYTLPHIAHMLGLDAFQFGTWAGVALHDMASVADAARSYGHDPVGQPGLALDTANIVKLTRVIWILPLSLAAGKWFHRGHDEASGMPRPKAVFPWFILFFVAASGVRSLVASNAWLSGETLGAMDRWIKFLSGEGFKVALFLIGAALTWATLKAVGWRALVHATVLWILVAVGSLLVIRATVAIPA